MLLAGPNYAYKQSNAQRRGLWRLFPHILVKYHCFSVNLTQTIRYILHQITRYYKVKQRFVIVCKLSIVLSWRNPAKMYFSTCQIPLDGIFRYQKCSIYGIYIVFVAMHQIHFEQSCILNKNNNSQTLKLISIGRLNTVCGAVLRQAQYTHMMTSSNGNIFRITGPLCGEFTGPGEFPTQRPVTRSFDVFFDLRLNKRLSKQPWGWWFETL